MVQIDEKGEKVFMVKKKESYLNFPTLCRQYGAIDSCFIGKNQVASLVNPTEIHLQTIEGS